MAHRWPLTLNRANTRQSQKWIEIIEQWQFLSSINHVLARLEASYRPIRISGNTLFVYLFH